MGSFGVDFLSDLKKAIVPGDFTRLLWKVGLVLLGGYALLLLVSALPQKQIETNVVNMAKNGAFKKNYPKYFFLAADMYTECVGIGGALNLQLSLESLLAMRNFGECNALNSYAEQPSSVPPHPYPRYTHGGQIVLKPFYTYLTISQIQLLTSLISFLLLVALTGMAYKFIGKAFALTLAGSFFFVFNLHVFLLVTHAVQFWVVLAGAVFALGYEKENPPVGLFGVIGACDATVSFLSMGSLSLGFPLFCYCLARWNKGVAPVAIIVNGFLGAVGWSVGFVTPWLVKWILTRIFLPPTVNLFGQTFDLYPAKNMVMVGEALFKDLQHTIWPLWLIVFVVLAVRKKKLKLKPPQGFGVLWLPAFVPLVWISLLPGQSGVMHAFFVQIILWPALAAILLFLSALPRKPHFNGKQG